ncbi:MAG: hypothetical protein IPL49_06920 [Saprospirales bacterium]|nr:hypothetical protein [Saprospirales bacterium]
MKKMLLPFLAFAFYSAISAQPTFEPFDVILEEVAIDNAPALQSFAWGTHEADWLLLGV